MKMNESTESLMSVETPRLTEVLERLAEVVYLLGCAPHDITLWVSGDVLQIIGSESDKLIPIRRRDGDRFVFATDWGDFQIIPPR
jgi:hypothetical protein